MTYHLLKGATRRHNVARSPVHQGSFGRMFSRLPAWEPDGQVVAEPEHHVVPAVGQLDDGSVGQVGMLVGQEPAGQFGVDVDLGCRHPVGSPFHRVEPTGVWSPDRAGRPPGMLQG